MTFDLHGLLNHRGLKLTNLHRSGTYLQAACPKCSGKDRFFTGPKVRYEVWHCRGCGHTERTVVLLGLSFSVAPQPAVKPWEDATISPERIASIRSLYASLADFAHDRLCNTPHALTYLANRGLSDGRGYRNDSVIRRAKLGYLDANLYRQWYLSLTIEQRFDCDHAGLPDGSVSRLAGHAAMFAGGYQGKIVFPYFNLAGEVVDLRTRSISPKDTVAGNPVRYTSPKNPTKERGVDVPYGAQLLGDAQRVILTEGEFKALIPSLPVIGLRGTSDFMPAYLQYFRNRLVILAFDNDNKPGLTPGQMATVKIGRILQANDVDIMVLDPVKFGDQKGLDDFVNAYGNDALGKLVKANELVTLSEFEAKLTKAGADLSKFVMPKPDPGTSRQWRPETHVDQIFHTEHGAVTVEQASEELHRAFTAHWRNWRRGHKQLFATSAPGTGKTTQAVKTALDAAGNDKSIAILLPTHDTIEEKIADGTLKGFTHVYGRRWDSDKGDDYQGEIIDNCTQADKANLLTKKGYSPGEILCPNCADKSWCEKEGYKSQFKGKANRAYSHGHIFSQYPEGEDLVIVDELSHKAFISDMRIRLTDLGYALSLAHNIGAGQRNMIAALLDMVACKDANLASMSGYEFYEVLERYYPGDIRDVDAWGDGFDVQMSLNELAGAIIETEPQNLPDQFGKKLFAVMSEDVRSMIAGRKPSGRLRLVAGMFKGKMFRYLELTTSKGALPDWYQKRPVLMLNATADAEIMRDLVGDVEIVSPVVMVQDGNEVIQDITRNNAKSAYTGDSGDAQARRETWLDQIRSHVTDEKDTVIVTTKALVKHVESAFPMAKIAYYLGLEGRNDLQAGTTILANAPAVNVDAVKREARALWPNIDLTMTRSSVAFDYRNAADELLAVEQFDFIDKRAQALLEQHRDASAVQAVHRARLMRETGRKVVTLFARPVPGLKPTKIITDKPSVTTHQAARKQATIDRLVDAGRQLLAEDRGFTVPILALAAGAADKTVTKYWGEIAKALDVQWFDLPLLQPMVNGGQRSVTMRFAFERALVDECKMHVVSGRYNNLLIAIGNHMHPLIPSQWSVDFSSLQSLVMAPPPSLPPAPARAAAVHNWAGLYAELQRSTASNDQDVSHNAKMLARFFAGETGDASAAFHAAYSLGIDRQYGIQWQTLIEVTL